MLRLWGRLNSINVQKAAFALEEAGAPYERIDAGMAFGIVGTPEYRAKNPNGLIPLLEDGDFTVWESNVIVRYVAAQYASGTLWPLDARARASADKWMDWQQTTLVVALGPAFLGLIRTPPEQRDAKAIEASVAKTDELMGRLNAALSATSHVAGERFTMGDIPIAATVHRWLNLPIARTDYPAIKAYYARVMARPAAQKTLILPVT
ncbi:MAG TPA: glutathione S-transferase family protein [Beijerinckiaceae bacterium]|nr:glutathione S-transferase family protein [Beijerinckiaceae bacterium]